MTTTGRTANANAEIMNGSELFMVWIDSTCTVYRCTCIEKSTSKQWLTSEYSSSMYSVWLRDDGFGFDSSLIDNLADVDPIQACKVHQGNKVDPAESSFLKAEASRGAVILVFRVGLGNRPILFYGYYPGRIIWPWGLCMESTFFSTRRETEKRLRAWCPRHHARQVSRGTDNGPPLNFNLLKPGH